MALKIYRHGLRNNLRLHRVKLLPYRRQIDGKIFLSLRCIGNRNELLQQSPETALTAQLPT